MRPFDHAWQILKFTTGLPGSQNFKDKRTAATVREAMDAPMAHLRQAASGGHSQLNYSDSQPELQPRPTPPAANHAALSNLSDEELEQMAAESERAHQEEMQRRYMDDLERREAAGDFVPTDIFDEDGNAAAGEGYMSGGRRY